MLYLTAPGHFSAQALILAMSFLLLHACAGRVPPPAEKPATPASITLPPSQRPYQIFGIWYYPIPTAQGYEERGIASWYGDDFNGKPTSSGEIYDMHCMTAAHKTLPLGTHVKVTCETTGKSVILRINDRGPFVSGRIIDLSYAAAQKLGMVQPGTVPVRVETVRIARQQQLAGKTVWKTDAIPDYRFGNFSIQLGAFQQLSNAQNLRVLMQHKYQKVSIKPPESSRKASYYRVQVGQFSDLERAQQEAHRLQQAGYPGAFVVAMDDTTS